VKRVKFELPEYLREIVTPEEWDLQGVEMEIEDAVRGADRDLMARRANALAIRQMRLIGKDGRSISEDPDAIRIQADHYDQCRKAVRKIFLEGVEVEPQEREEMLDSFGLLARDEICGAVVRANSLGQKKGSGSRS
jgi:hypothetical protein